MLVESDGNVNDIYTELAYDKCSEKDWDKFYPASNKNAERIAKIKKSSVMNCITGKAKNGKDVDLKIYGPDETTAHKRIEFLFRPCIPKQLTAANKGDTCVVDLKSQTAMDKKLADTKKYIGNPDFVIMYNN